LDNDGGAVVCCCIDLPVVVRGRHETLKNYFKGMKMLIRSCQILN